LMVFRWLKRGELWRKRGEKRGRCAGRKVTSGISKWVPANR
jgi:hypothetical protein